MRLASLVSPRDGYQSQLDQPEDSIMESKGLLQGMACNPKEPEFKVRLFFSYKNTG